MADLVRPAIEDAAYAALLSGYTREGLTGYATDADITAHMADVDAIRGGL